jgi:hypothetical protein
MARVLEVEPLGEDVGGEEEVDALMWRWWRGVLGAGREW